MPVATNTTNTNDGTSLQYTQTPEYVTMLLVVFGIVVLLEGWLKVIAGNTLSTEFGAQILGWLIPLIHYKSARIRRLAPEGKDNDTPGQSPSKNQHKGKEEDKEGTNSPLHRAATSEVALVAKDSLDTVSQVSIQHIYSIYMCVTLFSFLFSCIPFLFL